MRIRNSWIANIAALIFLGACGSNDHPPEWRLPSTESFVMRSSETDRDYEIMVALPRSYSGSQTRHAVLYVLDANGMFPIAVETLRFLEFDGLKEDPVIVGIGYPVGLYSNTLGLRFKDLTPTQDDEFVRRIADQFGFTPEGSGRGTAFLNFLSSELMPAVETRYRINPDRRALYGYSMGGLFAFYVLFERPELFREYLIGAPSLWWDSDVAWKMEQNFAETHVHLPAQVFLTVGSLDERHVSIVKRLNGLFQSRRYGGFTWHTEFFSGETHNSVIPLTISRGLRWLYGDGASGS